MVLLDNVLVRVRPAHASAAWHYATTRSFGQEHTKARAQQFSRAELRAEPSELLIAMLLSHLAVQLVLTELHACTGG